MSYRVHIRQVDRSIDVASGETILAAALRAGVPYPHGCQSGNCGACKSRLLSGDVELAPYSDYALLPAERQAGLVLACRAMPWADARIAWLELDETVQHPQRRLDTRVVDLERATHDILVVRLEVVRGGPFTFSAGQYASVTFPGLPARDFSMANMPDEALLEFHVRAMPGGAVSRQVHERLRPGDPVRVEGPLGLAFWRELHAGPILAVAGGSGVAPIRSIVDTALGRGARQPVTLYFGVRDEPDLYGTDHFEALAARHANFRFVPVLSEPAGATAQRTGFLADAIRADLASLDGSKVYLAGPPPMVETVARAAADLGARPEDVHADPFYSVHELQEKGLLP